MDKINDGYMLSSTKHHTEQLLLLPCYGMSLLLFSQWTNLHFDNYFVAMNDLQITRNEAALFNTSWVFFD